ncbi:acyltransferase [Microbacterium sp. NPDC089695]|uniref:acyltransferase family protein n=1 Tax=Microbacterium sp. NPDC089695 TaxID=3364198 RepID=UPI0038227636
MPIVEAPPASAPLASAPRGRDTGIDLLRALCVTGVVLLHAIMVGVTVTADGPVFANASEGAWWIVPVSWALQVMPLFFIIGGFAGYLAHRRGRERGETDATFVAARIHRLLGPTVVVVGVVGALLAALLLAGVPGDLVATAGFRFAQPLWFLGVFLLCQALLPTFAAAHCRAPLAALGLFAGAAVLVDVLRAHTGIDGLGFLNLAFVWLTLQQAGFFLADGTIDAMSRRARGFIVGGALAALIGAFATGVYSPDLVANINPPTAALLLVGVVHLGLVSLLRDRIARFSRRPLAAAFSAFVNRRTMTIYLWHMPVLLAMAGVTALVALGTGADLPEPSSPAWWAGRPLWLLTALALSAVLAVALARVEDRRTPEATTSARRLACATALGIAMIAMLLVVGTTVVTAGIAVAGMWTALRLARRSDESARGEGVADVVRVA